jgi:iron complex outermembrane receptor protein
MKECKTGKWWFTMLSMAVFIIGTSVVMLFAQEEKLEVQKEKNVTTLPEVTVTDSATPNRVVPTVTPGKITSTTKGETRPLETPQSITVLTRETLDQTAVRSLPEALSYVAGVVAGERGRRGFDDFGIRGQSFAGQERYIDGLSTMRAGYVPPEEIFGAERIEVLKGPASLLFGNVRPGGMVNIVSKRPKSEPFGKIGLTVGNIGFKEFTSDFGQPLSEDGHSAFRIALLVSDSDDATDHIFFKNQYIAPSFNFAFGARTNLTLLTSYHESEWLRNQGLPPKGTVLPNKNGPVKRSLFIGDPSFGHNDSRRARVGYELQHSLNETWKLQQNFRWDKYALNQRGSAFHGKLASDERTQARTGNIQSDDYRTYALDTYVNGRIGAHEITAGLDFNDKYGRILVQNCTGTDLGTIDLYNPTYGRFTDSTPCSGSKTDTTQDIRGTGLYARDHIRIGQQVHVTVGARHDRVTTRTFNNTTSVVSSEPKDSATTGMLGILYEVRSGVAPYVSVANSFVPVSGTDFNANDFDPETGEQVEVGVKFERDGGRQVASISGYDLKRGNVLTPDPAHAGFNVQEGEHQTKGVELELAADLNNGWNLTGAYAYTDATISKSNKAGEAGKTINNVPRRALSAWSMYRASSGTLAGWGAGLGLRNVSDRTGSSYTFTSPGYTVLDAAVNYQGKGWRAALNVRNLADKTYYGGALNDDVLTLGDTRHIRLNVSYEL